jgi:hypothetical protein
VGSPALLCSAADVHQAPPNAGFDQQNFFQRVHLKAVRAQSIGALLDHQPTPRSVKRRAASVSIRFFLECLGHLAF